MLTDQYIICPMCGTRFKKRAHNQVFCKRKCYKKYWNNGSKVEETMPKFACSNCGTITELDFFPKQSIMKWEEWKCPVCGKE